MAAAQGPISVAALRGWRRQVLPSNRTPWPPAGISAVGRLLRCKNDWETFASRPDIQPRPL
jgi:hypothetical protein